MPDLGKPWVGKVLLAVAGLICLLALVYLVRTYTGEASQVFVMGGVTVQRLKLPRVCGYVAGDGDRMRVMYKGWLDNGHVFDSTYKRQTPYEFELNVGQVIKGWDIGLKGMCMGEKRRLTIPPKLGYGAKGSPPNIPANAVLHFDIELVGMY